MLLGYPEHAAQRVRSLPARTRGSLERVSVYCPKGCQLAAIYTIGPALLPQVISPSVTADQAHDALGGADAVLLLWLAGDQPAEDGPSGVRLRRADTGGFAYFRNQAQWLITVPDQSTYVIRCRHDTHFVSKWELLDLVPDVRFEYRILFDVVTLDILPGQASGAVRVDVSTLHP
jgi:hypothetical protein